jgi:hypothetical protein
MSPSIEEVQADFDVENVVGIRVLSTDCNHKCEQNESGRLAKRVE